MLLASTSFLIHLVHILTHLCIVLISLVQKEELSKATLSRILCDNVPSITELQPDVFKLPNLAE